MKSNKREIIRKLGIVTLIIMMFIVIGIFALAGCDSASLSDHKTTVKAALDEYANVYKNNYSEANWAVVCGIVEVGKKSVDEATSKSDVDIAVTDAKNAIDEVLQDGLGIGAFYNLQEAFDNGLLKKEDLQSISSYIGNDFKSTYPKILNAGIESIIKETRAYDLRSDVDAKAEDVFIIGYYGEYNNVFAVMLADNFTDYHEAFWSETISGVTFSYANGNRILIWKEKIS